MKKVTFLERIKAVLKGGDDAKLVRFQTRLEKYFAEQIKKRKDSISILQDKLEDASDALNDTIESVNLDAISTTESTMSYCKTYAEKVQRAMSVEKDLTDQIEVLQEEIGDLENLQATIFATTEVTE